ncbi:tetratricopeptide repeat protein [Streptomyces sp. NPDC004111]|uniref:tetratricopeptide repeat protein n=1 Tax=Streptomyces sp. NPDC004111 TaxID=3364690 RepID=UPI0036C2622E
MAAEDMVPEDVAAAGTDDNNWTRRSLLRGAAALTGAAAASSLLGGTASALAGGGDADALFRAGEFEKAGRAYEEVLRKDPRNVHAARRRGRIGLLANRFADAEKYLGTALRLAPDDKDAHYLLGDCYLRQDKLPLAAPHWQAAGEKAYAQWFAAVRGEPYQVRGDIARLPIRQMDPMPLVEVSVNGGPTKHFTFYTGASNLSMRASVAKETGLKPVASQRVEFEGGFMWAHYGILDSFELGGIELRNVPVGWSSTESGEDTDTDSDGMIGTWVFSHLLTTFDYAGRQLVLRRRTPEAAGRVHAASVRAGAEPLPLWLADQFLHTRGTVTGASGSGTGVVGVNFGGSGGESAAVVFADTAEKLGVRTDHGRPLGTFAHSHPAVTYPCYPREIRIGDAAARDIYCESHPQAALAPYGFDVRAAFFHCFHKPYALTLDLTAMHLYIAATAP